MGRGDEVTLTAGDGRKRVATPPPVSRLHCPPRVCAPQWCLTKIPFPLGDETALGFARGIGFAVPNLDQNQG